MIQELMMRVLVRVRRIKTWRAIHRAADKYSPELQALLMAAFAEGHQALDREKLLGLLGREDHAGVMIAVDRAITATANALHKAGLEDVFLKVMDESGSATLQKLRPAAPAVEGITEFAFDITDEHAVDWAKKHAAELVQSVSKSSRDDIRQLVETAFEEQLTVDELAAEIEDVIGDAARAETIARTESIRASNAGQQEAWSQATQQGLLSGDEQQEWIATPDDRECPVCEDLDGQTVGLDESFVTSDGDQIDGPPAHPNCRCALGLVAGPVTLSADDQPRDQSGKWTAAGATLASTAVKSGVASKTITPKGAATSSKDEFTATHAGVHAHLESKGYKKVSEQKMSSSDMKTIFESDEHQAVVNTRSRKVEQKHGSSLLNNRSEYVIHVVHSKKVKSAAYSDDEPRDQHGMWTTGGPGASKNSARAKRALASHKPSTAQMQRHAESNETDVKAMVGGDTTGDNEAMDVVVKVGSQKHGVEVKTLLHNSHDKITMHPPSRRRKEQWAKDNKAVIHTVVLDDRKGKANSGHRLYYRRGVGAFRLAKMTKVKSASHLKTLMTEK